jgi:hypothetical protein
MLLIPIIPNKYNPNKSLVPIPPKLIGNEAIKFNIGIAITNKNKFKSLIPFKCNNIIYKAMETN